MDFELTDEQRLIQDTVRAFVDERVLPVAIQNDIDHKLDMELIEGMAELGILGVVIPEEYGGAGLDFVAEALACEEIERGEAAFRTLISVHVGLNSLALWSAIGFSSLAAPRVASAQVAISEYAARRSALAASQVMSPCAPPAI